MHILDPYKQHIEMPMSFQIAKGDKNQREEIFKRNLHEPLAHKSKKATGFNLSLFTLDINFNSYCGRTFTACGPLEPC